MATTRFIDHLLEGDHASRPAAGDVPEGTLYSCTTHSLVYQSDTATWTTWATLGGSSDLDAIIAASSGQNIADALAGAASPAAGNVFATMADIGGGGISTSYLGYNTVGGSTENMTTDRIYCKKITAGGSGNLLLGMAAYVDQTSENIMQFHWGLFNDNAGVIGDLITALYEIHVVLAHGSGGGVSFPARWLHVPMTYPLAASTSYWVGIFAHVVTATPRLYYDTSGSDRYMPMGATPYISDGGYTGVGTQTDSTRKYSIRALVA